MKKMMVMLGALAFAGGASAQTTGQTGQAPTQWQYGFLNIVPLTDAVTELSWVSLSGSKTVSNHREILFQELGCSMEGITPELDFPDFLLWTCLGRNGWEYAATIQDEIKTSYVFKRPVK